jgi:antitoxin HigA-1
MIRVYFIACKVPSLVTAIDVSRRSINEIRRERRSVIPEMVLRLARLFVNSPEFWLKPQPTVDLREATQVIESNVAHIQPLMVA